MNKSKTTVILPAGRDLLAREAERSSQPCFDTALRRLHEADRVLAEAKDTFQVSMEKAARALAPFDVDALVEANYGFYRGKTFRVREFSIGYRAGDPACLVPAVMAWGSIVGKDPETVQGHWEREHPGLLAWARSDDLSAPPPDVFVPPAAREDVRRYAEAMAAVRRATEHSVYCHRELLGTPEIIEYVQPVKPGEEGDMLNPGGWREFFKLRVKVERVHLKSLLTNKPWNPADLAWVAKGKLVSAGGRELGVSLEWAGNVSSLRAGAERRPWQRLRSVSQYAISSGYLSA
jgi:hypothetical protein